MKKACFEDPPYILSNKKIKDILDYSVNNINNSNHLILLMCQSNLKKTIIEHSFYVGDQRF